MALNYLGCFPATPPLSTVDAKTTMGLQYKIAYKSSQSCHIGHYVHHIHPSHHWGPRRFTVTTFIRRES